MAGKMVVAVKALIRYQDRYLLVRRTAKDIIGAGDWECPGGKLRFGETLEQALQREVMEETSLSIDIQRLLYATTFIPHCAYQSVLLVYLCLSQTDHVSLSSEHQDYRWITHTAFPCYLSQAIWHDLEKADWHA
ncbi:MAG: NUDIX domain-containing protein [Clostridia bacterium]